MKKTAMILAGLAAGSGLAVGAVSATGVAMATPGSGVQEVQFVARGGFTHPVDITFKTAARRGADHVMQVRNAADTVVQRIRLFEGGQTGWHSHHGPVVVVVTAGTLRVFDADRTSCTVHDYTAGQSFVDPGQGNVHRAVAVGGPTELWATYFDVPAGTPNSAVRVDAADPGITCPAAPTE